MAEENSPYGCSAGARAQQEGRLGMKEEEVAKLGELASLPEELGQLCFFSAVLRSLLDSCVVGAKAGRGAIGR